MGGVALASSSVMFYSSVWPRHCPLPPPASLHTIMTPWWNASIDEVRNLVTQGNGATGRGDMPRNIRGGWAVMCQHHVNGYLKRAGSAERWVARRGGWPEPGWEGVCSLCSRGAGAPGRGQGQRWRPQQIFRLARARGGRSETAHIFWFSPITPWGALWKSMTFSLKD